MKVKFKDKRTFDFAHPFFTSKRKVHQEFLIENHDKPITEDQYLETMKKIRTEDPRSGKYARSHRTPSYIKREYQRLVERYGFFPGGQNE